MIEVSSTIGYAIQSQSVEPNRTVLMSEVQAGDYLCAENLAGATAIGAYVITRSGAVELAVSNWDIGQGHDERSNGGYESVLLVQGVTERAQQPDVHAAGLLVATFNRGYSPNPMFDNTQVVHAIHQATEVAEINSAVSVHRDTYPHIGAADKPYSLVAQFSSDAASVWLRLGPGDMNHQGASLMVQQHMPGPSAGQA